MLDRTWDNFNLERWHENSDRLWPPRPCDAETRQAERLRETERRITEATGWNSSTLVIGHLLDRLRGNLDGA